MEVIGGEGTRHCQAEAGTGQQPRRSKTKHHKGRTESIFSMVSAKECYFKFKASLPSFHHCINSGTVRASWAPPSNERSPVKSVPKLLGEKFQKSLSRSQYLLSLWDVMRDNVKGHSRS